MIWALIVVGWVVGGIAQVTSDQTEGFGSGVTGSLVERIGLFTIIVLAGVVGRAIPPAADGTPYDKEARG